MSDPVCQSVILGPQQQVLLHSSMGFCPLWFSPTQAVQACSQPGFTAEQLG